MKMTVKEEIDKIFDSVRLERYRNNVINRTIRKYRDTIMKKGYDIGNKEEFFLKEYLKEKVKVEISVSLKTTIKELEQIVKG